MKKIILYSFCSIAATLVFSLTSCRKAPSDGEAFITLKSNEVRFLADTEILFFGDGFVQEFDKFRNNLIQKTREDRLSLIQNSIESAKLERRSLETSKPILIAEARDEANKSMREGLTKLQSSFDAIRNAISKTDSMKLALENNFSSFQKRELEIASKIISIQNNANNISSQVIDKINQAIVNERIAIEIYECKEKLFDCNPRTVAQMVDGTVWDSFFKLNKHIPSDLSGSSKWLIDGESCVAFQNYSESFIINRKRDKYFPDDRKWDQLTLAKNLSSKLESSKIANEIRQNLAALRNASNDIKALYDQAEVNDEAFKKGFQIWANSSNNTVDTIRSKLSERSNLENQLSKAESDHGYLLSIQEGSAIWNEKLREVDAAAENNYEQKIRKISERIKSEEDLLERVKSNSSYVDIHSLNPLIKDLVSEELHQNKLSSTRTGSDGKFTIPPKARYISAFMKREASDEEIFWLIKINMDEKIVKITNSNATMNSAPNGVSAYLGALDAKLD